MHSQIILTDQRNGSNLALKSGGRSPRHRKPLSGTPQYIRHHPGDQYKARRASSVDESTMRIWRCKCRVSSDHLKQCSEPGWPKKTGSDRIRICNTELFGYFEQTWLKVKKNDLASSIHFLNFLSQKVNEIYSTYRVVLYYIPLLSMYGSLTIKCQSRR